MTTATIWMKDGSKFSFKNYEFSKRNGILICIEGKIDGAVYHIRIDTITHVFSTNPRWFSAFVAISN